VIIVSTSANFSLFEDFGDDGLGSVLARLELRSPRLLIRLRLLLPNLCVLVAWQRGAASFWPPYGVLICMSFGFATMDLTKSASSLLW
jgi:hypothetical protein